MTQPATAALLARLEALEATHARAARRSRRWRGACLAALLACGGLFLMTPAKGQDKGGAVVVGSRFVLQGADGKTKAELKLGDNGTPHLVFYDKASKPRLLLSVTGSDAPTLSMLSPDGDVRVAFGLGGDGTSSSLAFQDGKGKKRLGLTCSSAGVPGLIMSAEAEQTRLGLGVAGNGSPNLSLKKADGGHSIILSSTTKGVPALLFYGDDGKVNRQLVGGDKK